MTTIRVPTRHRYAAVDRRTVNDDALSWRALGLLVWLLDKPNDWTTSVERLAALRGDGKHAVTTALRDLEAHGYLERVKSRTGGKWTTEWLIREVPPELKTGPGKAPHQSGKSDTVPPGDSLFPQVGPDAIFSEPTEPELQPTETKTLPEASSGKDVAHQLAVARWELFPVKPVCGFPALRKRIREALDSGHTPDQVGKVLPTMTVFSRNAFDFALGKGTVGRPQPVDSSLRDLPGGELDLSVPDGPTRSEVLDL